LVWSEICHPSIEIWTSTRLDNIPFRQSVRFTSYLNKLHGHRDALAICLFTLTKSIN